MTRRLHFVGTLPQFGTPEQAVDAVARMRALLG
jgi:hypothetical protein